MENFPRPKETKNTGYSGEIKFATDGSMQMHLAEKDLNVSAKHNMHINPVEKGHIAFRTDDLKTFLKVLKENQIPYADYGTRGIPQEPSSFCPARQTQQRVCLHRRHFR